MTGPYFLFQNPGEHMVHDVCYPLQFALYLMPINAEGIHFTAVAYGLFEKLSRYVGFCYGYMGMAYFVEAGF